MTFQRYLPRAKLRIASELLQCCHDRNLGGVTDCLSRGVDVNTVSEFGYWSGLTIAADRNYRQSGPLSLVEILHCCALIGRELP